MSGQSGQNLETLKGVLKRDYKENSMPEPSKGEKSSDYIGRCVGIVVGEGKTQDQALGKCYGMLRQKRGEGTLREHALNKK